MLAGNGVPDVPFGTILELMAWRTEPRIFVFDTFDRAGFTPSWSLGHQIGGQRSEQLGPELLAFLFGPCLTHRLGEWAECVQSTFKADPLQGDGVFDRGLGHGVADQVVGDEAAIQLPLSHFGRAAAEHFHFEGGLRSSKHISNRQRRR